MDAGVLDIGTIRVHAIVDATGSLLIDDRFVAGLLGGSREAFPEDFDASGWRFRDRCYVIDHPGGLVLIDTGVGPPTSTFAHILGHGGRLLEALDELGYSTSDISHVVLTHVHADHAGWSTVPADGGFLPTFPNARYHVHPADLAWARDPVQVATPRAIPPPWDSFIGPIQEAGLLEARPTDHEIMPGIELRHAPGHTPGHRCVVLSAKGRSVTFTGDLVKFSFQLELPSWPDPSDLDPSLAQATRVRWLSRIASEGSALASAHLPQGAFVVLPLDGEPGS
jgi:glyoxylase-like metal-dependent hydrolase (beta-lactamase superfamily II)